MVISKSTLVPGYVRQTLSLAKAAGLKAWLEDQDDDNEDDCKRIVCKIRGTRDRLRAAKFVTKKFKFPVYSARIDAKPFRGWIERVKQSDEFELATKWTAPIEIARDPRYAVERLTFSDVEHDNRLVHRTGFWGTPANIERVAGLPAGRLFRPRPPRASKELFESSGHWFASYFPSGNVLCVVEAREWTADDARREQASLAQSTPERHKKIAVVDAKRNPGLLPDYVLDRNRLALAAGLTIERQDIKDGLLTTWYRGTKAQWRATPFCQRDDDEPFTRAPMHFYCFSPATLWLLMVTLRPDKGDYRGSMPRERLPERTEKIGDGITLYTMPVNRRGSRDYGRVSVYIGEGQALVDWKIAPAEILRNKGRYDSADVKTPKGSVTVWEREVLPDGRVAYFDFGMPSEDVLKIRNSFRVPSELTTGWSQFVGGLLVLGEQEYARGKGPNGKRFTVAPDSLEAIRETAEELIDAIRCANVIERDPPPPKIVQPPWRSKAAKADPAFQELLAGLSSGTPPKD